MAGFHMTTSFILALLSYASAQSSSTASGASSTRPSETSVTPTSTSTIRVSSSISSSAALSSTSSGPPRIEMGSYPTLTACSDYSFQYALRNVPVPSSYTVTFAINNIGLPQSILPSGSSAPVASQTSVVLSRSAIDPGSFSRQFISTSSPVSISSASPTTGTSTGTVTSSRASISSSTAASLSLTTSASRSLAARSIPIQGRSGIPINGTLGFVLGNTAYRWSTNLPQGNYVVSATCAQLGITDSAVITVIEPLNGTNSDLACLAGWASLSSVYAVQSATNRGAVTSSQPTGALSAADDSTGSSVSGGTIAGVVVGVIAALAIAALVVFCCVRRRRRRGFQGRSRGGRDRVDLDQYGGEKLPSSAGSPGTDQMWSTADGSPQEGDLSMDRTNGRGMVPTPMPLAAGMGIRMMTLPRSQRGSIDSISQKSIGEADRETAESSSLAHHVQLGAFSNSNPNNNAVRNVDGRREWQAPKPISVDTPVQSQNPTDLRRSSLPTSSPSAYHAPMTHHGSGQSDYTSTSGPIGASTFAARAAGDRASGVAFDAVAGRRSSPPYLAMANLGAGTPPIPNAATTGNRNGTDTQRKGSIKRKPVPILEPGLEAQQGGKREFGSGSGSGMRGGQEWIIMPDAPAR